MARQRKTPLKKIVPKPAPIPEPIVQRVEIDSSENKLNIYETPDIPPQEEITAQQIRTMSVIQMRRYIEAQQDPALDSLMDVYKRETLQTKLINKLGL